MEDFDADAMHGADLLGQALGRTPGAADLDEFVAFQVFVDGASEAAEAGQAVPFLRAALCDIFEVIGVELEPYLWHRDRFTLEVALGESDEEPHLSGHMRTGDGAEDEWYVVYLLKLLTARRGSISCRVWDVDGELILIEAALVAPGWLMPENAENRCWLRGGLVHLLRGNADSRRAPLRQVEALSMLRGGGVGTAAKDKVQRAIESRLEGSPTKAIELSRHMVRAVLPSSVARLFVTYPQLVGVAADHLPPPSTAELRGLLRDLTSKEAELVFDSRDTQEMVCMSIRLTKCQYARLVGLTSQLPQRFTQKHWRAASSGMPSHAAGEKAMRLGAMLSCGLEVAFLLKTKSATAALRWPSARSTPEALPQDVPWWHDNKFAATAAGMRIPRESTYSRQAYFQQHQLDAPFREAVLEGWRVASKAAATEVMPTQESDDSEEWLHVSVEELDEELRARQAEFDAFDQKRAAAAAASKSKAAAQQDKPSDDVEQLQKELAAMGGQLSSLLERASNLEGIEAASPPDREGIASSSGAHCSPPTKAGADSDSDEDGAEDPLDVLGMEENPSDSDDDDEEEPSGDPQMAGDMLQYMSALDDELGETLDAPLQEGASETAAAKSENGISLSSHHVKVHEYAPLSLDVHAMEHIFASICSEAQMQPGPASLLLGELGLGKGGVDDRRPKAPMMGLDGMD